MTPNDELFPRALAAAVTAAVVSAAWTWNHVLSPPAALLVIGGTVLVALALAWIAGPLVRAASGRHPVLGTSAAIVILFGVTPAIAAVLGTDTQRPVLQFAAFAALGALLAVAVLVVARLGWFAAATAVAAAVAAAVWISPPVRSVLTDAPTARVEPTPAITKRVAVIGMDSADWQVIDPLLAAGELPNLRRVIERGTSGVLRSVEPTYSPVVWTSIFSGKTPEKHGITGWYDAHSENRRVGLLWTLIEGAGLQSVVSNVPGTWPPKQMRGALISGFPIPTMLRPPPMEQQQVLGRVFATQERPGSLVPTAVIPADGATAAGEAVIGEVLLPPRTRLRNFGIDYLERKGLLPPRVERVAVRFDVGTEGKRRIEVAGHVAELASGEWSPWFREDVAGHPVRFRLRALEEGGFYCTPFFQDPRQPLHPFTNDQALFDRAIGDDMYVVESAGWRIAEDADLRTPLAEHMRDVEEQHLRASQALAAEVPDWDLYVHIFTLIDRTSHAFWRFHAPADYPPIDAEELRANRDRLLDAYRFVDARFGELVATLPDDTTIFILSDHGSAPSEDRKWGSHRTDGVWIAAGPGIRPQRERIEISVLDVTPTILAALGLPGADDMDGVARVELFDAIVELHQIASYESEDGAAATPRRIDASTENQLRSLGYVQ